MLIFTRFAISTTRDSFGQSFVGKYAEVIEVVTTVGRGNIRGDDRLAAVCRFNDDREMSMAQFDHALLHDVLGSFAPKRSTHHAFQQMLAIVAAENGDCGFRETRDVECPNNPVTLGLRIRKPDGVILQGWHFLIVVVKWS